VTTADAIQNVMKKAGRTGIDLRALRARCRMLDALDKASGEALLLEDADHATLVQAIEGFEFGMATRPLLEVVEEILQAAEPPAA
jgi:hypothetical protein